MFITYEHDEDCEKVLKMCRDKYGQFTVDRGKDNLFTYLHMNIKFDDDKHCVYIDQKDYYEDLIAKYSTPSSKSISIPHMMQLVIRIRNGCYPLSWHYFGLVDALGQIFCSMFPI
jgi:hypothetical protein